ncbi:hypothetical protein M902_1808 [Bacteriovorax sp. BAL6_X]|uniref:hypothetical protein n=1 Tax=Bacteriovorax sp. BAL6_X TaxID=1201290 RepID=UPI0003855DBC|nr:hypothetical protein [Bacteriovorax sp. BAL6_X]EPZ52401.1 hypothetical protein M902_1808 [Bacteriovorax sp. BAL6_X]
MALPLQNTINEENFHSSLYIDDPRVTQLNGHLKLLDGFSRKLFKQSNTCFDLQDFKGTQQSNIQLDFHQKVIGTNLYNPFFSKYYNNVYNSHVDKILKVQDQKITNTIQIAIHKTTYARERDTEYVDINSRYNQLIRIGDFFKFSELCGSGYVNSFSNYAGVWFTIVFNRSADSDDTVFINLLESYLRLFDSTAEPKLRAQLNRELANRSATLYAEFRGLKPLTVPIQNLRDIAEFRSLITRVKSSMLVSDAGLYMALEYTPWGYNDEFQKIFYNFLVRNSTQPIPSEPSRAQWFNFYQNMELARLMSDAIAYESDIVERFEVCRNQMLRDWPLRGNEKKLFVNHLDTEGAGVALATIYQILSEERLKSLQDKLEKLQSGEENSVLLCSKRLNGQAFLFNHYRDLVECKWFDDFTKSPSLILDALCPLTPK